MVEISRLSKMDLWIVGKTFSCLTFKPFFYLFTAHLIFELQRLQGLNISLFRFRVILKMFRSTFRTF